MPAYEERELTVPVKECDASGFLSDEARGWSRRPLHICNLSGRWPRKKKWNFWLITNPRFAYCTALANVDYIGLAFGFLLDFKTLELVEKTFVLPLGAGCNMPECVDDEIRYSSRNISLNFKYRHGGLDLVTHSPNFAGKQLDAELSVSMPEGHETLNVLIPWSRKEFQFTSKQNTMPVSGSISLGGRTYECDPSDTYACLDYGRGVWPYRVTWNWASGSGHCGDDLVGLQFGGQWTDGTGYNENGICLNGRLHKISEDMIFSYDRKDYMKPWRLQTDVSDDVDLTITPFYEKVGKMNLGVLSTEVHQVFGHFSGKLKVDGRTLEISDIVGWSEEHVGKW